MLKTPDLSVDVSEAVVDRRPSRADMLPAVVTTATMLIVSFSPLDHLPVPRPVFFVVGAAGLTVYWMVRHLRGQDALEPAEWGAIGCYLAFLAYVLFSVIVRIGAMPRDPMLLPSLGMYLPVMFLAFHAGRNRAAVVATFFVAGGAFVVAGLFGLVTGTLTPSNEVGISIFPPSDPTAIKATYQTEGIYLGSFFVLGVCGACWARTALARMTFGASSLAALYLGLLGGSRSTLVASSIVAFVVVLRTASSLRPGRLLLLAPVTALFLFLLAAGSTVFPKLEGLNAIARLEDATRGDSTMRGYLFEVAVRLFTIDAGTITFGAGLDEYDRTVGRVQGCCPGVWYPHNVVLELLAGTGLVGATLFLTPLVVLLVMHATRPQVPPVEPFRSASFALMAQFWIAAMGTGGLHLNWILIFFTYVALAEPPRMQADVRSRTPGVGPGSAYCHPSGLGRRC